MQSSEPMACGARRWGGGRAEKANRVRGAARVLRGGRTQGSAASSGPQQLLVPPSLPSIRTPRSPGTLRGWLEGGGGGRAGGLGPRVPTHPPPTSLPARSGEAGAACAPQPPQPSRPSSIARVRSGAHRPPSGSAGAERGAAPRELRIPRRGPRTARGTALGDAGGGGEAESSPVKFQIPAESRHRAAAGATRRDAGRDGSCSERVAPSYRLCSLQTIFSRLREPARNLFSSPVLLDLVFVVGWGFFFFFFFFLRPAFQRG